LEDENKQTSLTEKALRHAVSHPKIDDQKYVPEVVKLFGVPYFNPLDDRHKTTVKIYAEELRKRALVLLLSKSRIQ
jgi:hypothetical protein